MVISQLAEADLETNLTSISLILCLDLCRNVEFLTKYAVELVLIAISR
jgi:hypothetical protein